MPTLSDHHVEFRDAHSSLESLWSRRHVRATSSSYPSRNMSDGRGPRIHSVDSYRLQNQTLKEFISSLDMSKCDKEQQKVFKKLMSQLPKDTQVQVNETGTAAQHAAVKPHTVEDMKASKFRVTGKFNVGTFVSNEGRNFRVENVGDTHTDLMEVEHGYDKDPVSVANDDVVKYRKIGTVQSVVQIKHVCSADILKQQILSAASSAIYKAASAMFAKVGDYSVLIELLRDPVDVRVKMPRKKHTLKI